MDYRFSPSFSALWIMLHVIVTSEACSAVPVASLLPFSASRERNFV